MTPLRTILRTAAAALTLAATLPAQLVGGQWDMLYQFDGGGPQYAALGRSVAGAGDVDGDGFDDIIVGEPGAPSQGGFLSAGSAYVYSGATGGQLLRFDGEAAGDNLGWSVAVAGDVNGDSIPDLIVGAFNADPGGLSGAGSTYVYSGATGSLLHRIDGAAAGDQFGFSVAGAGDVNGDGVPDQIVSAVNASPGGIANAGSVYVYSGATGGLLHQFDGGAGNDGFGCSVASAEDVDGDGFADLIVGARWADVGGVQDAGSAYVYSGATGALVWQFNGATASDYLGYSVAGPGDVDGDGFDDLIVGAPAWAGSASSGNGAAFVYSGANGGLIWQFSSGNQFDYAGWSVVGVEDMDGDGLPDMAVGAPNNSPSAVSSAGSVYLLSGVAGELIWRLDGENAYDFYGAAISGSGDINGNGTPDFVGGAPDAWNFAGSVRVHSLDPFLRTDAGSLSVSGGSTVHLGMDFPTSEAGARYAVLASITGTGPIVMAGLEIPLTQDNVFNLITAGNVPAPLQGAFGTLNANGKALATLSAGPALAPAVGQTIYFAAVTYDVGPLTGRMSSVVRYLSITP